ncbi:MAG: hypothetical protein NUV80_01990 [Candidatus Berkelbacteria bacterium]|nr:hypothetical protein [Candidatus Berkelbacteria bacterium]
MSSKPKEKTKQDNKLIDDAILGSTYTATASAGEIAKKLNMQKSLVARRFAYLGYEWTGTRWVYRHNPPKGEG